MKMVILAVLMTAAFGANATNNGGGCQGNCPSDGGGTSTSNSTSHGGSAVAGGGDASAVGIGLGVGVGGDSSASVGDIRNTANGGDGGSAVALGGAGGHGGDSKAYGGNQSQGQGQGQQMEQSNVGVNSQGQSSKNDNLNVSGSKSIAQQALENSTRVDASSKNANQSSASGNTTATTVNVGGDSTLVERNAPPVFLGNLTATMSCAGGFNAGASDRNGSGAFGLTWISSDCRSVVMGREFVGIGMPDVACRIWKTTKGYKRAVKADPSLANVDCTAKPEPAAVVVPVAPELAPRIPRG